MSISYHLKIISLPLVPQTDTFAISNHDGKITINGPLDFENEQRYTLFVTAKVSRGMLQNLTFVQLHKGDLSDQFTAG